MRRYGRIIVDPTKGLECNKFIPNRRIGQRVWSVDIARSPNWVKYSKSGGYINMNIHRKACVANEINHRLNKKKYYITGRE